MTRPHSLHSPVGPDRSIPEHWSQPTVVDVACWRADQTPDELAYTFLVDGDSDAAQLTYGELDRRARAVARGLLAHGEHGCRALVVLEPGLPYIEALFGCFYAGIVPVPVYPPDPFRIARTLPRLQAIFGSAECQILIGSAAVLGGPESAIRKVCPQGEVAIEDLVASTPEGFTPSPGEPGRLALLQYTSGTTGEPRGVPITHANLMDNLRGMEQTLDVADAVAVQWLPPYHDLGLIGGVFLPLFAGRHMVLMSPLSFMQNPSRWLRAISDFRATTSAAPNFGYELCMRKVTDSDCEGLDLSTWQVAVSGAERVRADTLDRFCERFAPYGFRREAFVPAYGMAETTLMVSVAPLGVEPKVIEVDADALSRSEVEPRSGGRKVVGCGSPGPGVDLRVVDPMTCRETQGVGEVWVRGEGVASGYWRTDSGDVFGQTIAGGDNQVDQSGDYLRTGDLGFLQDGELFLTGRRKEMIILAGRNFYPQDIELAVQSADKAFKTDGGAAVAVEAEGSERLALFQEVHRPRRQDLQSLVATARRVAAEETGQEPSRVVLLPVGELPKTSSGKTRRAECWELYESGALMPVAEWPCDGEVGEHSVADADPPRGATEEWLAACWAGVLGIVEVSRGDNFFSLGGRSLQVTRMLTVVAERTGLVLPLKTLFDRPTLADLAAEIDRHATGLNPDSELALVSERVDLTKPQPLTPSQQRFWMVEQLGVEGGANVPIAIRLEGRLDIERLEKSLRRLVDRHDALRCSFAANGSEATQQVVPCESIAVVRKPLPGEVDGIGLLERVLDADWVWEPFDLAAPPLLRCAVFDAPEGQQLLVLVLHHLVCDGASINVLAEELAALYEGSDLPPAIGFAAALSGASDSEGEEPKRGPNAHYWANRLASAPVSIDLPLDTAAGAPKIATALCTLDRHLASSVDEFGALHGVTPFAVYLCAFQSVLARYSGQQRIGVGTAIAGRADPALMRTVGCFINTIPLLAELRDEAFGDLLRRTHGDLLADLDHSSLPWEEIVAAADKPRQPGRMPLVQTFLVHDDRPVPVTAFGDAKVVDAATDYRGLGVFDLSLVVETARPEPRLKLIHDAQRFPEQMAGQLLESVKAVLQEGCSTPTNRIADLPIPAPNERQTLAAGGEPRRYSPPAADCVVRLFRSQAQRSPDAVAVSCGGEELSYRELDALSSRIAANLGSHGVVAGDRVGLLLRRSIELPALMLGVWKSGAAYVPLDADYPESRLCFMADDAELAQSVVDDGADFADVLGGERAIGLSGLVGRSPRAATHDEAEWSGDRLAYLVYTSGSTGKPKGVMIPHRAVANLLHSFATDLGLGPGDSMLGATTISFDISVLELFLPLVTGARLVLADSDAAGDASRLSELLRVQEPSHVQGAPSTFRMLLSAGWRPTGEQTILCGGEEVTPDLAATLVDSAKEVWNVYGPTETTIWSTLHRIDRVDRAIPIGRPLAGTRCYILDDQNRLAPSGVWGQLAIAGAGVADGYWNRPELTAARFPADPFCGRPGERMYLTGDTARWAAPLAGNNEGVLEFGGRRDSQVKIRGHRVELREIEIALNAHDAIGESAVIANNSGSDHAALVAFVSPANGKPWTPDELREHLAARLPGYMSPSLFVEMDRLPRTDNGKIDRKSLPLDALGDAARSAPVVPPRTPLEEKLAGWVRELLRIDEVGVYDNFFELGGQSLLATQLVVRVRDELGVEPPLREIYERPTVAQWAELILRCELAAADCISDDLLSELDNMTDEQAAAYLESLTNQ